MNLSIEYEYSDCNANRYILTVDSLEYTPVQHHESSTGFYSGGEPKKKSITPQTYELIRRGQSLHCRAHATHRHPAIHSFH